MLGGMKIFASVVALVLTAVLAGWLWVDATAGGGQEASGVLITGPVDPDRATEDVRTPSADGGTGEAGQAGGGADVGLRATTSKVVSVLQTSADELMDRADQTRQAEREADQKAKEKAAKEKAKKKAEKEKAAKEKAEREKAQQEQQQKAVPVQPAPVNPGGWCEWDEDDGWECDDWDDWDDDD